MLELERTIQVVVEEEARDALASGWAELSLDESEIGPTFHLEPMKLAAAPLEIYLDSDELAVCSAGRKGMSCEFFSQSRAEISDRVRALVAAVVRGEYVERSSENTSELHAEWPGPSGKEEAHRDAFVAVGPDGQWRTHAYEPY